MRSQYLAMGVWLQMMLCFDFREPAQSAERKRGEDRLGIGSLVNSDNEVSHNT